MVSIFARYTYPIVPSPQNSTALFYLSAVLRPLLNGFLPKTFFFLAFLPFLFLSRPVDLLDLLVCVCTDGWFCSPLTTTLSG